MKKLVIYGRTEELIAWAEERIPGCKFRDDARTIGLAAPDGMIIASTVFDTFSQSSCFISVAADTSRNWLTRDYLYHCFAYPFIQCNFRRVTCVVSEHNTPSLKFTRACGWKQEGIIRAAGIEGEDMLIFGMLRQECRWVPATLRNVA